MASHARSIQSLLTRDRRLRCQIHSGSWMEIQYSLRSFGIDIAADWLDGDVQGSPFSSESIRRVSEEYRRIEEERKRAEAPFCDPTSDIALYPNPQDVIMGKNRSVAHSWPGNLAYTAFMRQHAARYGAATTQSEKMEIATKTLEEFKLQHRARFLTRLENIGWEVVPYMESRLKVSQSLRDEYRKISASLPAVS